MGPCLLAAKNLDFTPVGFEISKPNCELARKLGLDARNEEFPKADIQCSSANIVFFCHSFEHVTTPNDYLRKAYDVLEEDGILFLEVPNFNRYWYYQTGRNWIWLDPIAHVAQHTGESLCNMVKAAGFTIKKCMTPPADSVAAASFRHFSELTACLKKLQRDPDETAGLH